MGKIYTRFIALKKQAPKDWFMDKIGLVKFEDDNKKYEIYFTRERANKYSIIHCKNNTIEDLERNVEEVYNKICSMMG